MAAEPSAPVIAAALATYLETLFERGDRLFGRLDGFDEPVYEAFLGALDEGNPRIANRPAVVRTTGPIAGRERFALEEGKTATWHRNHVPSGHALLLMFNGETSDAQSLKDVYPITETRLTRDGLVYLIGAAFRDGHVLSPEERTVLTDFVERFRKLLAEPQLRSLTDFLTAVSRSLSSGESSSIQAAIAESLPALRMFRCRELAGHLSTARGDRLLRDSYEAARVGEQLLEESKLAEYRTRLKNTQFQDDREPGGLSAAEKHAALGRFLFEEGGDDRALQIDWSEVAFVLHKKARTTSQTKLRELAQDMKAALARGGEQTSDLPDYGQEAVAQLETGSRPNVEDLERLSTALQDKFGRALTKRLRNLAGVKSRQTTAFLAELTNLSLEILGAQQDTSGKNRTLQVSPASAQFDGKQNGEAAAAFRVLYGGVRELMPAIEFDLDRLWKAADDYLAGGHEAVEEEDQPEDAHIVFGLSLLEEGGGEELRTDLIWQCPADGLALATLENVKALAAHGPIVPTYESRTGHEGFDDLDLGSPRRSVGRFYDEPLDLAQNLKDSVLTRPGARPAAVSAVTEAVDKLAVKASEFAAQALTEGLLASDVFGLLEAYDALLAEAARRFTYEQEIIFGLGVLSRAWTVGPRESQDWVLVTLLHPLKLLWWRNRAARFGELVGARARSEGAADVVDDRRFGRELERMHSSAGFPSVLSLLVGDGCKFYLPAEEREGYELFLSSEVETTRDVSSTSTDENVAADETARQLAAVVGDYLKTYPFSKEGVEIFLVECRNAVLPGRLVERLDERGLGARLSVVVHTRDRGAEVFSRVSGWLAQNERFRERPVDSFFPRVTLKVLEGQTNASVLNEAKGRDIVVLADVLSVGGQAVRGGSREDAADISPRNFVPFPRSRPAPFSSGDRSRRVRLDAPRQPSVVRRFYNVQYSSHHEQPVSDRDAMPLSMVSSLRGKEDLLQRLHERFNWVVCYDAVADRFLLKQTLPEKVQVIRYSMGLGSAGRHNLTVSSSSRTRVVVTRRMAGRLREMFPQFSGAQAETLARHLVQEANDLSGDIVLRAAGPGAYLNELIGLVATKRLAERRYRREAPGALKAWIYLDDHKGWFSGKYPDLVFVAVSVGENGSPDLRIEVLEAKCVSTGSFEREVVDAERQVAEGLDRLTPAWAPYQQGKPGYLDAPYWRDQLVRAVAANLSIVGEQQRLWQAFQRSLDSGSYSFVIDGHACAFCYDGRGTLPEGLDSVEEAAELPAANETDHNVTRHLFSQDGLHSVLREEEPERGSNGPEGDERQGGSSHDLASASAVGVERKSETIDLSGRLAEFSTDPYTENPEPPGGSYTDDASPQIARGAEPREGALHQTGTSPAAIETARGKTANESGDEDAWLAERARDLDRVLNYYGIKAHDVDPKIADVGPSIVRFKIRLRAGERLARLQGVAEDVGRELALHGIPLISNVHGTTYVSIDLPRPKAETVSLLPLLASLPHPPAGELHVVLGQTPNGKVLVEDLSEFPHLLVGGATNSGKSVFLRSLLLCLLDRHGPDEISVLIVDPKRTDFSFFDAVPTYLRGNKVITDGAEAREALLDLVHEEMPRRQRIMTGRSLRVKDFNHRFPEEALKPVVAIIDEYAQLISVMSKRERETFERDLMSLAQVARSTGIHLVLATQRPSADIVTPTLKANLPAGIAFKVAGSVNSRIVIDQNGAENLLGRGDMLLKKPSGEVLRLQAPFLSEEELAEYLSGLGQSAL